MMAFPDTNQIQSANTQARNALGLDADLPLSPDEANVWLKYLLLAGLDSGEHRYWRKRWQSGDSILLRERLEELLVELRLAIKADDKRSAFHPLSHTLLDSHLYCQRLIDMVSEAILSEPLAPETCLQSSTLSRAEFSAKLPGVWNHAVIFASSVFFTHEFYPLAVDAYVHDTQQYGYQVTNIIGVNSDWLTANGACKRILYMDSVANRIIETDLDFPLQADSVQFLCLGKQEQPIHAALSAQFQCMQVNPAPVSALADDKAATLAAWSALSLDVPAYLIILPGDSAAALDFLNHYTEIAVKPNQATEGEKVAFFQRGQHQEAALESHLSYCWENGAAIIQQRRDGVIYRDTLTGISHSLALRFNLAFDGKQYRLESAYAQLGQDENHPAASGRGGRITPVNEILSGLAPRNHPKHLLTRPLNTVRPELVEGQISTGSTRTKAMDCWGGVMALNDWAKIREQAEQAAGVFQGLLLVGLDILLDLDKQGNIIPVFLEANPRPAGLSHSRLLADDPFSPANIGVSLKLWNNLSHQPKNNR